MLGLNGFLTFISHAFLHHIILQSESCPSKGQIHGIPVPIHSQMLQPSIQGRYTIGQENPITAFENPTRGNGKIIIRINAYEEILYQIRSSTLRWNKWTILNIHRLHSKCHRLKAASVSCTCDNSTAVNCLRGYSDFWLINCFVNTTICSSVIALVSTKTLRCSCQDQCMFI